MSMWKSFMIAYQTYLGTVLLALIALFVVLAVVYFVLQTNKRNKEKRELRQKLYNELSSQKKNIS